MKNFGDLSLTKTNPNLHIACSCKLKISNRLYRHPLDRESSLTTTFVQLLITKKTTQPKV